MLQVPTTVFTTLEFGSVGLSEQSAVDQYGEDNVEVSLSVLQGWVKHFGSHVL